MDIDNWFKMVQTKFEKEKQDVDWFKERVRVKFIYRNNLIQSISQADTKTV